MPEIDNTEAILRKFEPMLEGLSMHELHLLNQMVVERIRLFHKAGALMSMSKFKIGDRVSWDGRDGVVRLGIVTRLNHKTISIRVGEGVFWKVSPQLLRKEN